MLRNPICLFSFVDFPQFFIKSLYDPYLSLSRLLLIQYFNHLMKNWLSADTAIVNIKVTFGIYSGYYWGIGSYKSKRQDLNTRLFFVLWNGVKEICCTQKLFVSFHPEIFNCCTQLELSWFQDFEQKRCLYWIVYLTSSSLVDVSLLNKLLFLVWCKAKVIFDQFKVFLE